MIATREQILASARPCDHAAHLYVDGASLVEAVGIFADAALARGEAVVFIATAAHLDAMAAQLERMDHRCDQLHETGQLVRIDALRALSQIMKEGEPDRTAFDGLTRPIIEAAKSRFGGIAAYGELVNILWHQSDRAAAHTLEQWWNELIAEYGFSLLCGYRVDLFDFQECVQEGIDTICSTHTHLVPVTDCKRLEEAVDAAIAQVFHNGDANALRQYLLSRCDRRAHMPPALAALLSLRDVLPALARDVRMIARDHYRRPTRLPQ